ncbi:hypothetical protein JVT61DRAFT_14417 [Boletus reticuloceps]|uniref:Uncharacterized protein n=1 Tax=Boletus reticuloceps TaxID=495285 RepID=A0A8I2YTA8_9AGAM|nr:hypothetical protein JVT61DRAFT_14417 [Boletus reticuloceps]
MLSCTSCTVHAISLPTIFANITLPSTASLDAFVCHVPTMARTSDPSPSAPNPSLPSSTHARIYAPTCIFPPSQKSCPHMPHFPPSPITQCPTSPAQPYYPWVCIH